MRLIESWKMESTEREVYAGLLNTVVTLLNETAGSAHDMHVVAALEYIKAARHQFLADDPLFMTCLFLGIADLISIEDRELRRRIADHLCKKVILP